MTTKVGAREIDKSISSNILQLYSIEKLIGKGAYGVVWKAYCKRHSNRPLALKKIFDAFRNKEDAQRTFREVTYLKAFKGHPNIIQLLNVHRASNNSDLYLVFEYMSVDLHHYIVSGNKLVDNQVRYITYQILKALKFIHSGNVIHRDLKPSNVLLNADCVCKIADFGLARSLGETREWSRSPMTDYVATRWYRAPEILLGSKRYTKAVDTWSLGCVVGEMLTGQPLFPGGSSADQLSMIVAAVDMSGAEEDALGRLGLGLGLGRGGRGGRPLGERLLPKAASDLVLGLLRVGPALRLTCQEALRHPWVRGLRAGRGEPVLSRSVRPGIPDGSRLPVQDYRAAVYTAEGGRTRLPGVARVSRCRIKPFSSEPENITYKAKVYEPTRYPPLTSKSCFQGK